MSEYENVPVSQIVVGDEVKVDGYGRCTKSGLAMLFVETVWWPVRLSDSECHIATEACESVFQIRRSSIVACRRRKPEPAVR